MYVCMSVFVNDIGTPLLVKTINISNNSWSALSPYIGLKTTFSNIIVKSLFVSGDVVINDKCIYYHKGSINVSNDNQIGTIYAGDMDFEFYYTLHSSCSYDWCEIMRIGGNNNNESVLDID